jgi:hypothetical protein
LPSVRISAALDRAESFEFPKGFDVLLLTKRLLAELWGVVQQGSNPKAANESQIGWHPEPP